MAEGTRGDARRDRTSARERRRNLASKPFEALDEAAGGANGDGGAAAAAKHAARTAAAAAIAGGLAGAAKALVQRRAHDDDDGAADEPDDTPQRAESTDEQPQDEQESEAPVEESDDDERDRDAEDGADDDDEDDAPPAPAATDDTPSKGGSMSEARDVVERARGHVEALLGKEADSVSGISRRNGSWAVDLEVVEVHRVPDSTDVLSTYEVVLDDDGGLLSLERRGRYRRSQVEEGR